MDTADNDASHLMSAQRTSELQAILHPLVLLSISDYIARHTLRNQSGPIVGALLGQQNGREITIEHAYECHIKESSVVGGYLLEMDKFESRLEQMREVHKDRKLDLVGWYTLLPTSGPTPNILGIHHQIIDNWNESAVLLGFHTEEALGHSVGGKLPLTLYESSLEVDGLTNNGQDGEDKHMEDGTPVLKLKFRELAYTVETDETEMISMNYIAAGGGTASAAVGSGKDDQPTRSVESTGKGKRRLVESQSDLKKDAQVDWDPSWLTREEEEMIASLNAKSNAIKMLQSRIRLLSTYLDRLPPSFVEGGKLDDNEGMDADASAPSFTVLRQIQALVSRLDLVIPADKQAFEREVLHESNDVDLVDLLNTVMQAATQARDVGKKFSIVENSKTQRQTTTSDFQGGSGSPAFTMPGIGDVFT